MKEKTWSSNGQLIPFHFMKHSTPVKITLFAALALSMMNSGYSNPLYEEASHLKIGDEVPNFAATTIDDEEFAFEDYKGKVVLVNLFATWCGPCKAEMPMLQKKVHEANADNEDFKLIGFSREEGNDQVKPFAKKLGLKFALAGDPERKVYDVFAEGYIPRLYLIGKDGIIKYAAVGADEADVPALLKAIETALAE